MKFIKNLLYENACLILVIIFALLSILDLANYGLPPTHDGEYHIMRFWQFSKVLSSGVLYPRWAPDFNNGFGVPLFNYVYPLPNYFGAFFHVLGFGFIDSFKLNMAIASVIGAIFFYLWSRKYWGNVGGLVAAVFYTFSPYHLLDIYVRGSVGEVWSLAIIPALLWAYINFLESKKYKYFVLSSVFLALLIYAHNILAVVFFGFFVIYAIFSNWAVAFKNKKWIIDLILIIFLGFGLAAPFWLPAILEIKFVSGLQIYNPIDYFPVIYKLVYSSWGYGYMGPGVKDQMSVQIGIADLFVIFESICVLLLLRKDKESFIMQNKNVIKFILLIFFVSVFLITPYSLFLWKAIPITSFIQFPWRLLSLVILCASFLAGALCWDTLYKKHTRVKYFVAFLLIIISIGLSIKYDKAPFYHKRNDEYYLARANFTDGTNSPGNVFNTKWLSSTPKRRNSKISVLDGKAKMSDIKLTPAYYSVNVSASQNSEILINTAYFPGWQAKVNGKNQYLKNVEGRMVLSVNKGSNNVIIWLGNTPVQNASYIYLLFSLLLLALIRFKPDIIE